MFAKLFGGDDDQVLVVVAEGEDGPEVKVSTKPAGLGVCSIAAQFPDTDKGWDDAQAAFQSMDEDNARRFAAQLDELAL